MPAQKKEARTELASRLREAREYVGLSQDEVAQILKIPRSAVSLIETADRKVDVIELTKFAELYQRPLDYFTGTPPEMTKSEEVKHLARAVSKLSEQDRAELLRFAEFLQAKTK